MRQLVLQHRCADQIILLFCMRYESGTRHCGSWFYSTGAEQMRQLVFLHEVTRWWVRCGSWLLCMRWPGGGSDAAVG
jgi:hypothetical protein